MGDLATVADVKRVLHRDQNDTSIDDALTAALEAAEAHVTRYLKQDYAQRAANTWTINDIPEDGAFALPVIGAEVVQVRFYRTPTATPYVGVPLTDYEVQHDGLQPPQGVSAAVAGAGTLAAGTWYWVVTAVNAAGETSPSAEVGLTVAANKAATVKWGAYGGEKSFNVYRVQTPGTETSNAACLAGTVAATTQPQPDDVGGPTSFSFTDAGAATSAGSPPPNNQTATVPARRVRLHPTFFDVPFEGAVSAHLPDNWSRVEVDYLPPASVPPAVREGVALTAAALYVRGPITASAFTSESMGGYSYSQRPLRGQSTGSNEVIPEVAKALIRPWRKRRRLTT